MSADTVIQWAHDTVNFWWGCAKVSTGCANCYAEKMAKRLSRGRATWGPDGLRWLRVGEAAMALLRLNRRAEKAGQRRRVFINSMSDTFEDRRDLDGARGILFAMAPCVPWLDLLLLTKRPENIAHLVPAEWLGGKWPKNVWIGTTVENQMQADERIPHLLGIPAPLAFLSCEPLLGPLDIVDHIHVLGSYFIHWVIVGGESGQRARAFDIAWIRSLRDQCALARTPFFVKQLGRSPMTTVNGCLAGLRLKDGHGGDITEWPVDLQVREFPLAPIASNPSPSTRA